MSGGSIPEIKVNLRTIIRFSPTVQKNCSTLSVMRVACMIKPPFKPGFDSRCRISVNININIHPDIDILHVDIFVMEDVFMSSGREYQNINDFANSNLTKY